MSAPALSVVVPSVNGLVDLIGCLDALERQRQDVDVEVVVVDRCGEAVRSAVAQRFPHARVVAAPAGTPIPDMRVLGFDAATASSVAVIEDHVIVPPGWAKQLLDAQRSYGPVVGGSVPPSPHHPHPAVYHAGKFSRGAAVLALFETRELVFETFVTQHFVPSQTKLVITLADPDRRLVYEINGEPAARAYAHALGVEREQLGARDFACHPLILEIGDQLLPRAIRAHNPDQSLSMACAVEEGLVVSIAKSTDPLAALERSFAAVERRVPAPAACLVFDSLFRRIELEAYGLDGQVGELFARKGAVGFSSYGEQLGPLHVNHTLTGLALGGPSARTTL